MTRPQGWLALILALAIGSLLVLRSLPLSLGLDLRGGSQLTLLVKPAGDITRVESKQLEAVKEVLERRVNGLGVSEASVTTSGSDRIVVQLPGVQDPRRAAEVLGTTARLEFRAQKPETQQELSNLTRLKRLIVARQEQLAGRNQTSDGEQAPDVSGPLTDLRRGAARSAVDRNRAAHHTVVWRARAHWFRPGRCGPSATTGQPELGGDAAL